MTEPLTLSLHALTGLPRWHYQQRIHLPVQEMEEMCVQSLGGEEWRRKWHPTPVFLPRKSRGQRILAGYSPGGHKESDMTECLRTPCFNWCH